MNMLQMDIFMYKSLKKMFLIFNAGFYSPKSAFSYGVFEVDLLLV